MIKIFNAEKELKLSYTKELDLKIEHVLSNGDKTLSFLIPINSKLTTVLEEEGYIETKDHCFVIKGINSNFKNCNVIAKLNVEELEGKFFKKFEAVEATAKATINSILVDTGWSVGYSNIKKKRTTRRESKNAFELIQVVKKIFNCDIVFDTKKKQILIYDNLGSYKGEYIRENMNLTNITAQGDSYDFYTRLEAEGKDGLTFSDINNGKSYVEDYSYSSKVKTFYWKDERYTIKENLLEDAREKLKELSKPRKAYTCDVVNLSENISLGDTIEIVSKRLNIKEKQRVIKYIEYPETPEYNYVELSNNLVNLEDLNNRFEEASKTIDDVTNSDGTVDVDKVSGLQVKVNEFTSDKVNTTELNAVIIQVGELNATKANITDLNATNAEILNLKANKADIVELNAVSVTVGSLQANVANIETLVNGNLTSDNIHSLILTSSKVTVENGFIKNAMIENVDVSKLNAGTISTDKFLISSNDGGIEIRGATQQFKDKNNKVRLQLGKDSQGNFNFILRGEDGTSVLLDHTGLKAKAITDGLIVNSMLGQGAVTGDKVNIGSLIQEVNKDANTSTIKATKIQLDKEGQSLDIAFNTLKTNVNNIQVGGRNLIKNALYKKGSENWSLSSGIATIDNETLHNGHKTVKIQKIGVTTSTWGGIRQDNVIINPKQGEMYTLSYWYLVKDKTTLNDIFALELKGRTTGGTDTGLGYTSISPTTVVEGEWIKVSFVLTINRTDLASIFLYGWARQSGVIWFSEIKAEKGNKATDFTEAPEDVEKRIESNTTQITAQQGKIEALISDTSIVENGATKKLKDAYANLKLTVNGLNSTIGSHTTNITNLQGQMSTANSNISNLSGKVQTVESKQVSFEQNLSGISQKVSSAESNITTLKGQMTTANNNISAIDGKVTTTNNKVAELTTNLNGITQKVSSTETNVTNLQGQIDIDQSKVSGELLPQGYKANDGKGYFINRSEPASRLAYESNKIKLKNKIWITTDFIRADSSRAIHWIIEGTVSSNNKFYFGIERYDKNKQPVNGLSNNGTVYFIENPFTGQRKGVFYNDRKDTAYIKLRVLNDWNSAGDSATAEISYISLEQNPVSLTSEVTNTNSKVVSLETNLNGISSKVSSVESSVATINGNITNLQNRMSTAESKITSSAIINTVSSTINTAKQEAINSANSNTANQLKNYATTSSVTQTVNSWVAKFSSSGGANLLLNGGFKRKDRYGWYDIEHSANGTNKIREVWSNMNYVPSGKNVLVLRATNTTGEFGVQQNVKVKANTKYTLSFYVSQHRCPRVGFVVRNSNSTWLTSGNYNDIPMATNNETGNGYVKKTVTFNSGSNTTVGIELCIYDSDDNGHAWFYDVMLNEGEIALPWSPHHSECYEGSTQIDASGVTIFDGAIRVKNKSGTTVLQGDSFGNLSMRGSIETINDYGRLYLNGNSLKGFLNSSSTTPIYASGVWRPYNDSYQTGYVSVGNTNALIGDDNGCLYMSGDNNPNGTRATLKYSRNSGNVFGAVEFTQYGGTSLVSSLNGGRDKYGIWNSAEGYVLPFKGNEYLGRNNRYWDAIYVRTTVSYNLNSVIDESKLLGEVQSETQRNKINTPTKKDFIECIKELDFGVYDSSDNINVGVLKTTNELTCQPIINTSLKLGVNNARNLLVKECTDREGENPIQTIDLISYCSALAITLQDTIGKIESLENENLALKERLAVIESFYS